LWCPCCYLHFEEIVYTTTSVLFKISISITTLPIEVLNLSQECTLTLAGCQNLSEDVRSSLISASQQPNYAGPTIYLDPTIESPIEQRPIQESIEELFTITGDPLRDFSDLLQDPSQRAALQSWLFRFSWMADYRKGGSFQKALAEKILSYMDLAQIDLQFRSVFLA